MTTTPMKSNEIHESLKSHMLVDGMPLVLDIDRSSPARIVDAVTGREFLDFFTFFASAPLGTNPPELLQPEAQKRLLRGATNHPSNSDIYTPEMAEFVSTMSRVAIPPELPHLFLVSGGALAVENAMKAAFDWKVRKNLAAGRGEKGSRILHFDQAFHGRSGYTLTVTNTSDPRKTKYFPRFDWPRVSNPFQVFPETEESLARVQEAENTSIGQIEEAFRKTPHEIAAILIEPIQGEGGDNHFRPQFLRRLREIADTHEALLIADEVQTGVGLTGTFWAYQQLEFVPDILCFGKKMQVCGILAGKRIEEVENHVFQESSRINSTWGGSLADMVRSTLYLEVIERDGLVENARVQGEFLLDEIRSLHRDYPKFVTNPRGRGLMCAFSCPSGDARDALLKTLYDLDVLMLPCGDVSVRFRPPLCVTRADLEEGMARVRKALDQNS